MSDTGTDNKIIVVENGNERELAHGEKVPGFAITLGGKNNLVKFFFPTNAKNCSIECLADDCKIEIRSPLHINELRILMSDGEKQTLTIDEGLSSGPMFIRMSEECRCEIGKDCMINSATLRPSEGHAIIEAASGEIISNPRNPLRIGEHCWIGQAAIFTKNASIPDGTIVGAGAVVTKSFSEKHTAIAGNPASVIRRGVIWKRESGWVLRRAAKIK